MGKLNENHPLYGATKAERYRLEREEIAKRYEVYPDGRVFDKVTGEWKSPMSPNKDGYVNYSLKLFGGYTLKGRHRLIALFHIDNPDPSEFDLVNHINETPGDDRVDNLEWCNARYNVTYGSGKKKMGIAQGKPVMMLDMASGEILNVFHHRCEAARTLGLDKDIQGTAIKECCMGKRKSAYGYRWEYAG